MRHAAQIGGALWREGLQWRTRFETGPLTDLALIGLNIAHEPEH
jgi:hypothetical protein